MNALIYDIEILKAIPDRRIPLIDGIEYCTGWDDHANMGVACICAYDYAEERYRVFTEGSFDEFLFLCRTREPLVGFNNISFDNAVLMASLSDGGTIDALCLDQSRCYDLLREIWAANGFGPVFVPATHGCYGLDAVANANGLGRKTGNRALAPVWWQQGHYGKVIDYCVNDVRLTKLVFDLAIDNKVKDPKTGQALNLRAPAPPSP